MNYVLFQLDFYLKLLFIGQLVQVGEIAMADHLMLIVAETKEKHWLSALKARVNDLHLNELARELNWSGAM